MVFINVSSRRPTCEIHPRPQIVAPPPPRNIWVERYFQVVEILTLMFPGKRPNLCLFSHTSLLVRGDDCYPAHIIARAPVILDGVCLEESMVHVWFPPSLALWWEVGLVTWFSRVQYGLFCSLSSRSSVPRASPGSPQSLLPFSSKYRLPSCVFLEPDLYSSHRIFLAALF